MTARLFEPTLKIAAYAIASALVVAGLAGCGASNNFVPVNQASTEVQNLGGIVHGGPNAVQGATITLYTTSTISSPASTNNFGYGQAPATGTNVLASTTTDSQGNFSFTSSPSCSDPNQQVYIVATGGKSGTQSTANAASVLMAAIGPCTSLNTNTYVFIDEATTIAAAYALDKFMSIGTSAGADGVPVNISAPANNNAPAASVGCTVSGGQTTACKAAGLAHAFLNAANLVNAVGTTSAQPTGQAYAALPTNSSAIVPQSLINALANAVESCVNSDGTLTGTTAPCAILMTATTPGASIYPGTPTAPTNTLQALVDLAAYPANPNDTTDTPSGPTNITSIFNLATSVGYYQPSITAAPPDFSIAINYPGYNGTNFNGPWNLGSDIHDNIYVIDALGSGINVDSFSSDGAATGQFFSNDGISAGCGRAAQRCGLRPDTLGHLYVTAGNNVYQLNIGSGGLLGTQNTIGALPTGLTPYDVAIDQDNDVYVTIGAGTLGSSSTVQELPSGTTAWTNVNTSAGPVTELVQSINLDYYGDLYLSSQVSADCCNTLYIGNNAAYPTAPDFTTTTIDTFTAGSSSEVPAPTMVDGAGNVWMANSNELYEVPFAGIKDGALGTSIVPSSWYGGSVREAEIDGDNNIAIAAASGGTGYVGLYYTGNGGAAAYVDLNPCNAAGATSCGKIVSNAGRGIVVDDTGSIWEGFTSGPTNVLQVLGLGAPTWGQQSFTHSGIGSGTPTTLRPY